MRALPAFFAAFAVAWVAATPVLADGHSGAENQIVLDLTEETWVEATDAKLIMSIETAVSSSEMVATQAKIYQTLSAIDDKAAWRTTLFQRNPDSTGLERWRVLAEARVTAGTIGDVRGVATKQSAPGYRVTVAQIDFSPSPEAFEKARAALRKVLYKRAKTEMESLNEIFGEDAFGISTIDFTNGAVPLVAKAQPRVMRAESAQFDQTSSALAGGGASMAISRKLTQRALVILGGD